MVRFLLDAKAHVPTTRNRTWKLCGTTRSDIFSLGVIAYQMLSGKLPYGIEVSRARARAAQKKLSYRSVLDDEREIPAWIDDVLRKAVHPNPFQGYEELSEFT